MRQLARGPGSSQALGLVLSRYHGFWAQRLLRPPTSRLCLPSLPQRRPLQTPPLGRISPSGRFPDAPAPAAHHRPNQPRPPVCVPLPPVPRMPASGAGRATGPHRCPSLPASRNAKAGRRQGAAPPGGYWIPRFQAWHQPAEPVPPSGHWLELRLLLEFPSAFSGVPNTVSMFIPVAVRCVGPQNFLTFSVELCAL